MLITGAVSTSRTESCDPTEGDRSPTRSNVTLGGSWGCGQPGPGSCLTWLHLVERATGIEPAWPAWKAAPTAPSEASIGGQAGSQCPASDRG
jgi:hypothetical protein